jgi:hypothetical protein
MCIEALGADDSRTPEPKEVEKPVLELVSSRFLATDTLELQIQTMRARIAINAQERCPFGLSQRPGEAPVEVSPITKMIKKTPFSDYINQIQISVVNATDKEFLVGARIFRLGQVFPIARGGERISVRVESIGISAVSFKNIKTNEVATKSLHVLPAGVVADNEALNVPGVTPDVRGEEQPLLLEFNSSPPTP